VFYRLLLFIFIVANPNLLFGQAQDYIWPTDASQYLTSTFGETRSAHFHSGLDIKTWGREGYKVFASKDGVVYRLGVSVEGYGKVIYLKHVDGTFTVYAHLQRMNDELQAYVDSVRMLDYSFETQMYIEDKNIRVSQGDIIGYTGSTGVGPPHLHFEIRDSADNPINALLSNLKVEDDIAPTFSALLVFPLSKSTKIRGSKFPQLYYPTINSLGELYFGNIEANGPIGLSVSTFDEANGVTNKYAVYELGLISEADTIFYERLDRFKFNEDDIMLIDRLPAFGASRRSYQTLFKKDGPENPFYQIVDSRSSINIEDSPTNFSIFSKDFYGNETKAYFEIVNNNKIENDLSIASTMPLYKWYWTEDWAISGSDIIDLKNPTFGINWDSSLSQRLTYTDSTYNLWSRLNPDKAYLIDTPDKKLKIGFLEKTFFDTLTISTTLGEIDGYPYIGIQPGMIPSRKDFKIEYYLSDNFKPNSKYQLFRINRSDNSISYVDSDLIGRTIHATPSDLGEFLIIPDNEPPEIEKPRLIQTSYNKWFVYITAIDSLSGIDFEKSTIFVNGDRGIVEFDNEEDLLIYYNPDFTPKETNIVTVRISDNAGNFFTGSYQL